jgi:hypothetical protein
MSIRFDIPADWPVLVLEDMQERITWFRKRLPSAVFVKSADEAIRAVRQQEFKILFLDHDLHWMHLVAVLALALLLASSAPAQKLGKNTAPSVTPQTAPVNEPGTMQPPMNYFRARRTVKAALSDNRGTDYKGRVLPGSILEFTTGETRNTANLRTLGKVTVTLNRKFTGTATPMYQLLVDGKNLNWRGSGLFVHIPDASDLYANLTWEPNPEGQAKAQAYADALNWLSAHARGEDRAQQEADWREFQQKAAAWRALSAKPPLSDAVRMHRLVAEDALKQKQFDSVIDEYEAGLEIDPFWPEGHYNAALLYGELNDYEWAAWHMRAYLELRPDAPDAEAVRDQLLLWQGKLKQ